MWWWQDDIQERETETDVYFYSGCCLSIPVVWLWVAWVTVRSKPIDMNHILCVGVIRLIFVEWPREESTVQLLSEVYHERSCKTVTAEFGHFYCNEKAELYCEFSLNVIFQKCVITISMSEDILALSASKNHYYLYHDIIPSTNYSFVMFLWFSLKSSRRVCSEFILQKHDVLIWVISLSTTRVKCLEQTESICEWIIDISPITDYMKAHMALSLTSLCIKLPFSKLTNWNVKESLLAF
jgi:hypothetical protein